MNVKTVEVIGKYMALVYESTTCVSLNKRPVSIDHHMIWIGGK
jgi:hypothetical protein